MYEGPFHVNRETIVKVAAYKQKMLPSDIVSTTVSDSVSVNFQPEGIPVPEGWLADSGKTFSDRGNDLTYGWNVDVSQAMRQRQVNPDPVCDSFCHLRQGQVWELSMPEGKYHVTIGLGDSRGESRNTVHVEGVSFCNELLLDSQGNEVSKIVAVNDGRLTIVGGSIPPDTKIRFVKVAIADPAAVAEKPMADNSAPAAAPGYIAGLEYRYYEGAWEVMPDAIVTVPFKTGTTAKFDLSAADRKVGYAFDFRGCIRIDREGEYAFYTTSDAGSRLKIAGRTVVDNDCSNIRFGFPSPHEAKGLMKLKKGLHPIHLVFYTDRFTPEPFLRVEYEGPDVARREVPAEVLYQPQPAASVQAIPEQPRNGPGKILALTLRHAAPRQGRQRHELLEGHRHAGQVACRRDDAHHHRHVEQALVHQRMRGPPGDAAALQRRGEARPKPRRANHPQPHRASHGTVLCAPGLQVHGDFPECSVASQDSPRRVSRALERGGSRGKRPGG